MIEKPPFKAAFLLRLTGDFRRLSTTVFIFFSAAAGTGIVSSYFLGGAYRFLFRFAGIRHRRIGLFQSCGGTLTLFGFRHEFDSQDQLRGVFADCGDHFIEHVIAFDSIFDNRVFLAVGTKVHSLTELVHIVDMVHPFLVDHPKQDKALEMAHDIIAIFLFAVLISLMGFFSKDRDDIFFGNALELGIGKDEIF